MLRVDEVPLLERAVGAEREMVEILGDPQFGAVLRARPGIPHGEEREQEEERALHRATLTMK